MEQMYTMELVCANCQGTAKSSCSGCRMVLYCGKNCQKAHWAVHETICRSPLLKTTWKPDWVIQKREPAFINDSLPPHTTFGAQKYLWGNVPAIDILQLKDNEGLGYEKDLNLLFAASGDMRNMVKTLGEAREQYNGKISVVLNDKDCDVVARNAVLLLISLVVEDENQAAECMAHIWYSAFITERQSELLTKRIRPLIEDVNEKIKDKSPTSPHAKTFQFGTRSLRIVLKKSEWKALLSFLTAPKDLTAEEAQQIRRKTTLASERIDYRHRTYFAQYPSLRLCTDQFRGDGILLPFSCSREMYTVPNPTFYQTKAWPMMDSANPLECFSMQEILKMEAGPATNDVYGKLYAVVQHSLRKFHRSIANTEVEIQVFCVDARELSGYVKGQEFARIEVSNVSDSGYLGVAQTIQIFAPMLQTPNDNPHATLITLFLNFPVEVDRKDDPVLLKGEIERVGKYMGFGPRGRPLPMTPEDPTMVTVMVSRDCVRDGDALFDDYMIWQEFSKVEKSYGVEMKEPHTIIEKWPMRLKLEPGQKGAKEEFDTLVSSGHMGTERYVEWKRNET